MTFAAPVFAGWEMKEDFAVPVFAGWEMKDDSCSTSVCRTGDEGRLAAPVFAGQEMKEDLQHHCLLDGR